MKFKKLIIFTTTGATFTFLNGEITVDSEYLLAFKYKGASDGLPKEARFHKSSFSGFAVL